MVFFVVEYRKINFTALYCLKKVPKMATFGPKAWVTPFVDMCLHTVCAMIETVVVHFNSGEYMRKDHTGCPEGKA